MGYAILLCDDDPDVRGAMRRTLRGYAIVEVDSPTAAMEALRAGRFDAIVSDYSLGADTDGLDLLQHVRLQYPGMVRFLVTASREVEVAARALNVGAVDRYFLKPWSDDQVRGALELKLASKC